MPRNYDLTWVEGRKLWRKVYKGHVYTISCRQLGLPEDAWNKVGSYQAGNAQWERKKVEIDEANRPKLRSLTPLEELTAAAFAGNARAFDDPSAVVWAARGDEQAKHQLPDDVWVFADPKTGQLLEGVPEPAMQAAVQAVIRRLGDKALLAGEPLPETLDQGLLPTRVQQVKDGYHAIDGMSCISAAPAYSVCVTLRTTS